MTARAGTAGRLAAVAARIGATSYAERLAIVVVLGALLRLLFLARQPLGLDEDFTAAALRLPLGDMLSVVAHDSAPPLHYVLTDAVLQVVPGLFGLRLVSAIAGIALIPLVAYLGRRIGGDAAGLGAAAFAAFIPSAVVMSQTARGYALAATLAVGAAVALWRAVESGRARWYAAYGLCAAAALWTSYFALFALFGIGLAATFATWDRHQPRRSALPWRRLVAAAALTVLAAISLVPWLVFARAQFEHSGAAFWVPPLGLTMLGGTIDQFFSGPGSPDYSPQYALLFAGEVVADAAGVVAFAGIFVGWRRLGRQGRQAAAFVAIAGGAGVLLMAVISVWRPILDARYAGVAWLPLFAIAGAGLVFLPRRVAGAALLGIAIPSLLLSTALTHRETDQLVPVVESRLAPGDLVLAQPPEYLVLLATGDEDLRSRLHVLQRQDPPWYMGTAIYKPGTVLHALPAGLADSGARLFYVGKPTDRPEVPLTGYAQTDRTCVAGACLTVYAPATSGLAPTRHTASAYTFPSRPPK